MYRRRSGMISFDYYGFRIPTIYRMTVFYMFVWAATSGFLIYLVKNKSVELVPCLIDVTICFGQHGYKLFSARQHSGSAENSAEVRAALGSFSLNIENSGSAAPEALKI